MLSAAAVLARLSGALVAIGALGFALWTGFTILSDLFGVAITVPGAIQGPGKEGWLMVALYSFFLLVDAIQVLVFVVAAGLGVTAALRAEAATAPAASMALGGALLCLAGNAVSVFHMGGFGCGLGMFLGAALSTPLVVLSVVAFARAAGEGNEEEVPHGW